MDDAEQVEFRLALARLVHRGAILRTRDGHSVLIGELRWAPKQRLVWFPAFGRSCAEASLLVFDDIRATHDEIAFFCGGTLVAALCGIDDAGVENPRHYHERWREWLDVVQDRQLFIQGCFERLLGAK